MSDTPRFVRSILSQSPASGHSRHFVVSHLPSSPEQPPHAPPSEPQPFVWLEHWPFELQAVETGQPSHPFSAPQLFVELEHCPFELQAVEAGQPSHPFSLPQPPWAGQQLRPSSRPSPSPPEMPALGEPPPARLRAITAVDTTRTAKPIFKTLMLLSTLP